MPSMMLSEPTIKIIISSMSNVMRISDPLCLMVPFLAPLRLEIPKTIFIYRLIKKTLTIPPAGLPWKSRKSLALPFDEGKRGEKMQFLRDLKPAIRKGPHFFFTPYISAISFISLLAKSLNSLASRCCITRPAFSTCLRYSGSFSISLMPSFHLLPI
jgi:hypothetical protein